MILQLHRLDACSNMWKCIAINIHMHVGEEHMRTVQMTLDEDLVQSVDRIVKLTHTTRSAFTRDALRASLANFNDTERERKHEMGYKRQPVKKTEFSVWEDEQVWGD